MNLHPNPSQETDPIPIAKTSDDEQATPPMSRRRWLRHLSNGLILVYSAFLVIIACVIGFIPYWGTFLDDVQKVFEQPIPLFVPARLTETPTLAASPTSLLAEAGSTCVIVWVEHKPDDLGKKSRARVWEQKISDQVKTTGMTARQFYDQVVQHNPQLIQDDYEFKQGKTYVLPVCQ